MPIDVLEPSSLAEAEELIMDEAILDVVEVVDVIHNCLTLILHKMLEKGTSDTRPRLAYPLRCRSY